MPYIQPQSVQSQIPDLAQLAALQAQMGEARRRRQLSALQMLGQGIAGAGEGVGKGLQRSGEMKFRANQNQENRDWQERMAQQAREADIARETMTRQPFQRDENQKNRAAQALVGLQRQYADMTSQPGFDPKQADALRRRIVEIGKAAGLGEIPFADSPARGLRPPQEAQPAQQPAAPMTPTDQAWNQLGSNLRKEMNIPESVAAAPRRPMGMTPQAQAKPRSAVDVAPIPYAKERRVSPGMVSAAFKSLRNSRAVQDTTVPAKSTEEYLAQLVVKLVLEEGMDPNAAVDEAYKRASSDDALKKALAETEMRLPTSLVRGKFDIFDRESGKRFPFDALKSYVGGGTIMTGGFDQDREEHQGGEYVGRGTGLNALVEAGRRTVGKHEPLMFEVRDPVLKLKRLKPGTHPEVLMRLAEEAAAQRGN